MSDQVTDILERLADLHKQATVERSHYYTGSCIKAAMAEIERLRAVLREIAERSCDSSEGEFRCSIMDSVTDIAREALAR